MNTPEPLVLQITPVAPDEDPLSGMACVGSQVFTSGPALADGGVCRKSIIVSTSAGQPRLPVVVSTNCSCGNTRSVSYTHLRAHETPEHLVCRLLLEKK